MKIKNTIVLVAAVLLLSVPAMAQTPFEASVLDSGDIGSTFVRYFTEGASDAINPACPDPAEPDPFGDGQAMSYCQTGFTVGKSGSGYRGYTENTFNFDAQIGVPYYAVFDYQDAGAGDQDGARGFYACSVSTIVAGSTSSWFTPDCSGATATHCIGAHANDYSAGRDIGSVPGGPINTRGGLRPIPVPRVDSFNDTTGDAALSWDAADCRGETNPVLYDLYQSSVAAGGSCDRANIGDFTLVQSGINGTSANVNAGTGENCVSYALRLVYGSTGLGGIPVKSRFLGANGQPIYTGAGGLSNDIYDIVVRPLSGASAEITWKSALEDGVSGYFVTRATSVDGQFQRVSDLIPANGSGSYSFVDRLNARGRISGTGLFYSIEQVSADGSVESFGPVQLELGDALPGGSRRMIRRR